MNFWTDPWHGSSDPLHDIAARLETIGLTDDAKALRELAREREAVWQRAADVRAGKVPLSVAVIGGFNAGKSSFINRLLGEDVCPIDACPTTSSITRFTFGDRRRIEWVKDPPIEVSEEEYASAVRHPVTGDGRASKEAASFVYHAPFPLLRDFDLIDTPGFDNPQNRRDDEIARDATRQADVLFYVLDINMAAISSSARAVLEQIRTESPDLRLYLVVNKADQKTAAGRSRILDDLQRTCGGLFRRVFLFSAKVPGLEGTAKTDDFLALFHDIALDKAEIAEIRSRYERRQLEERIRERLSQLRRKVRRCIEREDVEVDRLRERLEQWATVVARGEDAIRNACSDCVDQVRSAFSAEKIEDSGFFSNGARIVLLNGKLRKSLRENGILEKLLWQVGLVCKCAGHSQPPETYRHRMKEAWAEASEVFLHRLKEDFEKTIGTRYSSFGSSDGALDETIRSWLRKYGMILTSDKAYNEANATLERYLQRIGDGSHLWRPMEERLLRAFHEVASEVSRSIEDEQKKALDKRTTATETIELLGRWLEAGLHEHATG